MPFSDTDPIREPQPELDAERLGLSDTPADTTNQVPSRPSVQSNRILIVFGLAFVIAALMSIMVFRMIQKRSQRTPRPRPTPSWASWWSATRGS